MSTEHIQSMHVQQMSSSHSEQCTKASYITDRYVQQNELPDQQKYAEGADLMP
jgi:hypothetical protein